MGAVGDDAISRPPRGPDAVVSNRSGVGGRSVTETDLRELCDKTGAICAHSRQSPNGDRNNFDMTCRFVPSESKRLCSAGIGETNARLHCVGCRHFERDGGGA